MTTYPEDLIEALAALSGHDREDGPSAACPSCRDDALDVLEAIAAAGYRVVAVDSVAAAIHDLFQTVAEALPRLFLTADEKEAIATPFTPTPPMTIADVDLTARAVADHVDWTPEMVADYHARVQAGREARAHLDALQEAPDTETDPTPPHGTVRPRPLNRRELVELLHGADSGLRGRLGDYTDDQLRNLARIYKLDER